MTSLQPLLLMTAALITLALPPCQAAEEQPAAVIGAYDKQSFAPVRGESFPLLLRLTDPAAVRAARVEIHSSDGDLVRTLEIADLSPAVSDYKVVWDGRDDQLGVVPDEAYLPFVVLTSTQDQASTIAVSGSSGGEEVFEFAKTVRPGSIEYTLPAASRMLVRSGIENGPMLRTIIDWEPRTAGFHAERWSGRGSDNVAVIEEHPDAAYLIVGYRLPDHSIITHGNERESYRQYRERRNWPLRQASAGQKRLERNGRALRQEFWQPLLQQKSPRIEVALLSTPQRQPLRHLQQSQEMLTEVKLHPHDEVYLQQERYEISFFVDHAFIAEEEQGYVPFTWRWSPGRMGVQPGEHLLTVNVSGYNGQVGVKNISFNVIGDAGKD
jgi:hypothetical protein